MKRIVSTLCLLFISSTAFAALEAGDAYDSDMVVECASFQNEVVTSLRLNKAKNSGKYDISLVNEASQLTNSQLRTAKDFKDFTCEFKGKKNGDDFSLLCSRNESYGDNVTTNLSLAGETMMLRTSGMHEDKLHAMMQEVTCDMNMDVLRKILK